MLQFIAKDNDRYTIPESVQMALEGGCKWIVLHLADMDDAEIREIATEVIPLCKEFAAILTIEDKVELAKEMAIHGVLLTSSASDVARVRELCGPEAIIGVQVHAASDVIPLRDLDVDYVAFAPNMDIRRISENVEAIRDDMIMLPLVATGDYHIGQIADIKAAGVNGMALGATIADAQDPVAATSEIIGMLSSPEDVI